jgi:hypothetical protein
LDLSVGRLAGLRPAVHDLCVDHRRPCSGIFCQRPGPGGRGVFTHSFVSLVRLVTKLAKLGAGVFGYPHGRSHSRVITSTYNFELCRSAVRILPGRLLRFEDRLSVRKIIQPETLERQIPPMLLQTLVENAVKYGVSQNPGSVELSIYASIDPLDDRLCIRVDNSGHLNVEQSRSTGTGLRNARERLQGLFGRGADLQIAEDIPGLVRVAVFVPNGQSLANGVSPSS